MKQGEVIMASLGTGCAKIYEASNDAKNDPRPLLTLMTPADTEILNAGFSDAIVAHHPAKSFTINTSDHVRALYDFLKSYYEPESEVTR